MERMLASYINKDIRKKMVLIAGPRQCGKTTLSKQLLEIEKENSRSIDYLNWDYDDDRRSIMEKRFLKENATIVFDELHKFPRWKNWLKGIYDVHGDKLGIIVTGSARLDLYRRGGDSMLGRYHLWRLHPLGLDEFPSKMKPDTVLNRLMTVGGFPEPFLDGDERESRRWRRERLQRIIRDDIRDLEPVKEIAMLELLLDILRKRVSGLLSISNIAGDLQVAPKTVSRWIEIFERMYLVFSIRSYTKNLPRAIIKPSKVYFYDNGDVIGNEGAIFENLAASHILKRIQFLEDYTGHSYSLQYIRDKEGREVDFIILKNGNVDMLIEVKFSDENISSSLRYYAEKLKPRKAIQLVHDIKRPYSLHGVDVVDVKDFFSMHGKWF